MTAILILILIVGASLVLLSVSGQETKRGCGGGCATCGNRETCHRHEPGNPTDSKPQ